MNNKKKIRFGFVFSILLLGLITPLCFTSVFVTAQASIIEVYAYDAITFAPIIGADVVLYDDFYMYLDEGVTDITGFYEFTSLEAGDYWVEAYAAGYQWGDTSVFIASDGDTELAEFYLDPIFTPGNGFIDVYVYDSGTSDPIVGADVELYNEFWESITSGVTDIDGFYNFTGLGANMYWVEASFTDYEMDSDMVIIDFDGEGEFVEFYLEMIFTPGNGFIDVYVYDIVTSDPLVGADVGLYSENGYFITSGVTDIDGFYNFSGLGADVYQVDTWIEDYEWEMSYVTIDFDGEGEFVEFYLAPSFTPGNGFIDVYVYDNVTLNPLDGADLTLYTQYYAMVDFVWTDITGFYNFTGLGADTYIVEGNMMNYETNDSYVTIDFDGEGEYLELYLQPIVHEINILSPSDSDTIEGGVVYVICEANDEYNLDYIEVYVNAISITTFDVSGGGGFQSEFFVPVFGNGTNTIQIDAHWLDMTTDSDSIDVNSINVIPIVKVKVGDIMNYRFEEAATTNGADYNFTFTGWLSPFEINTHVALRTYDHTGTLMFMEYFIHVNVLNGYVPTDPTGQFYEMHFFPFSNLLPNPQVGDLYVMTPWWSIMTVTGSMLWEYTDVWILGVGTLEFYIEKSSNIVYYYGEPGLVGVTLIETTIDFLNPDLSDEVNLDYIEGDTGNIISWDATDMNPDSYIIYRDSVEVDTGFWDSVTPIEINVDGLAEGLHTYVIEITDLAGNTASDIVTVTVIPVVLEYSPIIGFLALPTIMCITLAISLKKRKFQVTK